MEYYITRFIRRDSKPHEEYFYHSLQEAENHLSLFIDDDSNLYKRIEITDENGNVYNWLDF